MTSEFDRRTLSGEVSFEGIGIHSGVVCRAVARPGSDGIAFSSRGERIVAVASNVTETKNTTTLGSIGMVEHIMAALAALEITDAEIEVVGPELPILDGSAKEYLEGLRAAGSAALGSKRQVHIFSRVNVQGDGEELIGISAGTGRWRFDWERSGHWPGALSFEAQLPEDFETEIAPARTFCHESDIPLIKAAGLGKGGNEHNTLVIGGDGYRTECRFTDEPARHKLLDLIGDLMLSQVPPRFLNVVGERSGHRLNVAASARLAEVCTWED